MVLFGKNPTSNVLSCVSTESDVMQRDQSDVTWCDVVQHVWISDMLEIVVASVQVASVTCSDEGANRSQVYLHYCNTLIKTILLFLQTMDCVWDVSCVCKSRRPTAELHLSHVHPRFWWQNCPTPPKFLVPEKFGTRTHHTRAKLLVPVLGTRNLGGELG